MGFWGPSSLGLLSCLCCHKEINKRKRTCVFTLGRGNPPTAAHISTGGISPPLHPWVCINEITHKTAKRMKQTEGPDGKPSPKTLTSDRSNKFHISVHQDEVPQWDRVNTLNESDVAFAKAEFPKFSYVGRTSPAQRQAKQGLMMYGLGFCSQRTPWNFPISWSVQLRIVQDPGGMQLFQIFREKCFNVC